MAQTDWSAAFPAPQSSPSGTSSEEAMKLLKDADVGGQPKSFLIVDVRRNDCEGGIIKNALNLPAQSFFYTREPFLDLCNRSGIKKVIVYCGSCNGRGPRCGGWLQDLIDEKAKRGEHSELEVTFLIGGIRGWVKDFRGAMMDGYDEKYWN